MKQILKLINDFKIDKKFWSYTNLSGEDYQNRSKPAPYIKLTIKIAKMLGLKNFVEIGSTRFAVSEKCIEYYNKENEPFNSPPCCTDGHCGYFFTDAGFEVHTVDIDTNCETQIIWSYNNLNKDFPENLKIHIPQDGIDFLKNFDDKIDILFLDGWDVGTPDYAEKHFEAYLSAKDKLSDVHLILIDDTDFTIGTGGKDVKLTPYLIDNGYTPLFNGRQTLFINKTDVEVIELEEEKKDVIVTNTVSDMVLEEFPKVILTLSTTPNRLMETREGWGVKPVIENLMSLTYPNYEIHFNIPYLSHKNETEYVIPEWMSQLSKSDNKLKLFRCHDYGPITKILPTIKRVLDPECIIITVDDDLIYEDGFIEYHLKKRKFYPNSVLCFAGIGSYDGSCHLCTTVPKDMKVKVVEGYKTVSYKRKFFEDDLFIEFIDKSWSDDVVLSAYLGKHKIDKILMNYDKDTDFRSRVESFPIVKVIPNEISGCNIFRSENKSDNYEYFSNLGYL